MFSARLAMTESGTFLDCRIPPPMTQKPGSGERLIASNKKALHDYFVLQKLEAGLALTGTEVKSLRDGKAQLKDAYVIFQQGEAHLFVAHVSPYVHGHRENHDPARTRNRLRPRREIDKRL